MAVHHVVRDALALDESATPRMNASTCAGSSPFGSSAAGPASMRTTRANGRRRCGSTQGFVRARAARKHVRPVAALRQLARQLTHVHVQAAGIATAQRRQRRRVIAHHRDAESLAVALRGVLDNLDHRSFHRAAIHRQVLRPQVVLVRLPAAQEVHAVLLAIRPRPACRAPSRPVPRHAARTQGHIRCYRGKAAPPGQSTVPKPPPARPVPARTAGPALPPPSLATSGERSDPSAPSGSSPCPSGSRP